MIITTQIIEWHSIDEKPANEGTEVVLYLTDDNVYINYFLHYDEMIELFGAKAWAYLFKPEVE